MVTAISAIIVFLVLVTVHEFGHFIVAKAVGIKVYEFAIGMGPVIFKKQGKETLYSVRALPIGGYCQMGEDEEANEDKRNFNNKPVWARFLVLFAGGFMNILLGFVIFLIIFAGAKSTTIPVVDTILPDSAAYEAGLQQGDEIKKIDGTVINTQNDVRFELSRKEAGKPIELEVLRNGQKLNLNITPKFNEESNAYLIGYTAKVVPMSFWMKIENSYYQTIFMSKLVFVSLFDLITGKVGMNMMSGPVGIVSEIGNAAKTGIYDLLFLVTLITINLGIFNLLPFPALDGGRILFLVVELIRGKRIPPEKEGIVHLVGFALLILLMLFATSNDIMRLFK